MKTRKLAVAALALLFTVIYGLTIVPGIGLTGDSIKFQYIGRVLGVPHSTGYPLYLVLNHLFTAVPVGTVAFRANLMSAALSVLTLIVLFFILARLTDNAAISFVFAAFFGLTTTFWSQAVVAEVYALTAFSLAFVLWALLKWQASRKFGYFIAFLFAYGLSLGNHLTILSCFPAALAFILVVEPKLLLRLKTWLLGLAALALGLGQYGLLFLRTAQAAPYLEHEVRTVQDLARVLSGHQFQGQMFAFSLKEVILERIPLFFRMLLGDITWLGLFLALAGFVFLFLRKRAVFLLLFLVFLGEMIWVLNTDIRDIQSHMIPVSLVCCLAAGFGLSELLSLWKPQASPLLPFLILPLLAWLAAVNVGRIDLSRNPDYRARLEQDGKIRALFRSVPAYSLILTDTYPDTQNVHYRRLLDFKAKKLIPHLINPREPIASQLTTKLVVSLQTLPLLQERLGLGAELEAMRGKSQEAVGFRLLHLLRTNRKIQKGFASHVYVLTEDVRSKLAAEGVPLELFTARAFEGGRLFLFYRVSLFDPRE